MTFTYTLGTAALPAAQSAQIKVSGNGAPLDYTIAVTGAPWLILTPTSGKTGTSVSARVNTTSLLAGSYTAVVTVSAAGSSGPVTMNVTLVIKNPAPTMGALPASLAYTYQTDQASPHL